MHNMTNRQEAAMKAQYDLDTLYPTAPEVASRPRTTVGRSLGEVRWLATQILLIAIGGVAAISFLAAMPVWIIACGLAVAGFAWWLIYQLIVGFERRQWAPWTQEAHR
jgi:hypothetical protein